MLALVPPPLPLPGPRARPPAELILPNSRFLTVDGLRLHLLHQPAGGPALLLLHGYGGWAFNWRRALRPLAEAGLDTYAVDLPGAGLSEKRWALDHSHPTQTDRLARLTDALGRQQIVLAGHSLGASVAAHFALRHPGRLAALIIVDGFVLPWRGLLWPGTLLWLPGVREWARRTLRLLRPRLMGPTLRSAFEHPERITAEVLRGYALPHHTADWDLGLLAVARDARRSRLPEPIDAIRAPTLILWGAQDRWLRPAYGRWLQARIPGSRMVEITGAGHIPQEEQPQETAAAIGRFLSEEGLLD